MDKLRCCEFTIGLWSYRVFADETDKPVLVQTLTDHVVRNTTCWREIERPKTRREVIRQWREACRQLDMFDRR